jgi:hypothetical protein
VLKPHRVLAEKISSYADEASAFMRRRRHHRRPYIRIQYRGGDAIELHPEEPGSEEIMAAVSALVDRSS